MSCSKKSGEVLFARTGESRIGEKVRVKGLEGNASSEQINWKIRQRACQMGKSGCYRHVYEHAVLGLTVKKRESYNEMRIYRSRCRSRKWGFSLPDQMQVV
jgi:hypothetical protein